MLVVPRNVYVSTPRRLTQKMSNSASSTEDDGAHLDELPDGAGCTEIWEHLSDGRDDD